jgi:tetratricopeptide (TPR) repeat protein
MKRALTLIAPLLLLLGCQNDAPPAPPDGTPYLEQAEHDAQFGDVNKAVANYTEAIRLFKAARSPKLGEAYFRRGTAYAFLIRKEEAAADFQEAARLGFNAPHP